MIQSYCNSFEYFLCSPYFNMWHVMHCYWIAQYVHNFGHYHIARKFGWGKLVSWVNRPWFAKLKLSKLVLTTKNLLANLLIPQTFFHQKLEKSQFTKLFPAKLSHYTVLSNIYTIDITYLYMCVSVCIYLATNIKEHEIIRLVKVSYVSWHITILQTPANIKWYNLLAAHFDYYIYFPFPAAVVLVTEPILMLHLITMGP